MISKEKRAAIDKMRTLGAFCKLCNKPLSGHPVCEICGVLVHDENPDYVCGCGYQHGILAVTDYVRKKSGYRKMIFFCQNHIPDTFKERGYGRHSATGAVAAKTGRAAD